MIVDLKSRPGWLSQRRLQLGVFSFGLLEDGDVEVGVLPQRQKIFVRGLRFGVIAGEHARATEPEMRECADRFVPHDSSVIDNLLEVRDRLRALLCRQMSLRRSGKPDTERT